MSFLDRLRIHWLLSLPVYLILLGMMIALMIFGIVKSRKQTHWMSHTQKASYQGIQGYDGMIKDE